MDTLLKQYFPMLRTRDEVLQKIQSTPALLQVFNQWTPDQQTYFLDFCTGARGVKVLYDGFFKEVMDPDSTPERLENFLSQLLGETVSIDSILANDSTRIGDESSILITDIVVRLADGSLADVEVQKVGYLFPGERCACYSSDLLLRQYKKVRSESEGKKDYYMLLRPVYTIVLFENSPGHFNNYPHNYIHRFEQKSDTGVKMELLQKYIFIALDIFREKMHNKPITNELDAWLMFFSTDDIDDMLQLLSKYPYFKTLYKTIYNICRNMEDVMGIFSEELKILDANSLLYLPQRMQEEIKQLTKENYQINLEKEQERRRSNIIVLNTLRKVAPEDFSAQEYANLLLLDPSVIEQVYEKIHSDPAPDEAEIFALLNQNR